MGSSRGWSGYLRAAFNARPWGMFVAPNWIALAAFGLLGATEPGFWVLGAGLELGYLALLSTNARFQRLVDGSATVSSETEWQQKVNTLLAGMSEADRRRYETLTARCRAILDQQAHGGAVALDAQGAGLGHLLWMYLRLLAARHAIERVVSEAGGSGPLEQRLRDLEAQLTGQDVGDDLRRSLHSQADILRQRLEQQQDAQEKLTFIQAELVRIQEQVELIREQSVLSTDPEALSQRIDQISATLGGTAQWIREQQQVYGAMDDLLTEPPPLVGARAAARQ